MTKYYTGVGSRNTPADILNLMRRIAEYLARDYYTLRTGDALGADQKFRDAASEASCLGNYGEAVLDPHTTVPSPQMPEVYRPDQCTPEAAAIAGRFHPAWDKMRKDGTPVVSDYAKRLHGRNSFQVLGPNLNEPSEFLICWTPDGAKHHANRGIKTGGTGTAISIADAYGVPVYNLEHEADRLYWEARIQQPIKQEEKVIKGLRYLYTAHYRYSGEDRTDITVKGQDPRGRHFAPTWEMVMGVKNGTMTEQEYVDRYCDKLSRLNTEIWEWLFSQETRTLVCFCPKEAFCHRNILLNYLLAQYGDRMQYMGWRD